MRAFLAAALLVLGVFALSCGDSDTSGPGPDKEPVPGWMKVRLSSTSADDGGIMFLLSGAQIDSVRSSFPDLFPARFSPTAMRVIVAGSLTNGEVVAEVLVPDLEALASYTVAVEQVAARDTYEQRPASSVSLTLER
jgi:hypothetical protein